MARMKLILTQEVGGLGAAGDVVDVAAGYGRNYLMPRGFAITCVEHGPRRGAFDIGGTLSAVNATIDLLTRRPGLYFDSVTQVDLRAAKTFTLGRAKVQGQFDLYNLFNNNTVLNYNTAYGTNGASWAIPLAALPGRLVRFGVQMNF